MSPHKCHIVLSLCLSVSLSLSLSISPFIVQNKKKNRIAKNTMNILENIEPNCGSRVTKVILGNIGICDFFGSAGVGIEMQ